MMAVYTGQVQNLCNSDGSAFCRKVEGGTLKFDPHNIRNRGIGGQVQARKGTQEWSLDFTCVGVALADLAKWWPTAAGVQVASFPSFLVEVDDAGTGQEFLLTACQPSTFSAVQGTEPDAQVKYTLGLKSAIVTPTAAGTTAAAYNALLGHTINDTTIQAAIFGAGAADINVRGWGLTNDLGLKMENNANTKSANQRTRPAGYYYTGVTPEFSCVTAEPLIGSDANIVLDDWPDTEIDFTVALANSVAVGAEDITISLVDFIPDAWNMDFENDDVVGFAHVFGLGPGTDFNRVTFA